MAKVILAIHGLANKPPKELLIAWWKEAINEGFKKNIEMNLGKIKFDMIYWADILSKSPLDPLVTDAENKYYIKEPYLPGRINYSHKKIHSQGKWRELIKKQFEKIFLNHDYSINYTFLTDAFIHHYFSDLDAYYTNDCPNQEDEKCKAKDLIRNRFVQTLEKYKNDEILILAHSMGSIILFDVLNILMPKLKIDTLITFGSPIGNPVIQGKMANELKKNNPRFKQLKTPNNVLRNWLNFSDLEDTIAIYYQLSNTYKANFRGVKVKDVIVQNDYESNGEKNPHKSFGYLRTPEMTYALYDFIIRKKENIFHRTIQFILRKTKIKDEKYKKSDRISQ